VVRLRVAAYEYLPMTATNRALLSVTAAHPGARIVAGSNATAGK
jgi:xanthine dehydrogenase iron-sulfur cluster and FAD-binding subunit A